jgi:hypothetical protein
MADLMSRLEVTKLAREIGASEDELAFLTASSPDELRELRGIVSEALAARHADLIARLAGLSRLLPVAMTAKIAQGALGPVLSARVAGALDPQDAARLAAHVDSEFLTRMATHVDARHVGRLVDAMPPDLVGDVGRRLLAAGEHVTLGRFLAVVAPHVAMTLVGDATAADLLQVALLTDDRSAVEHLLERLDDTTLAGMIASADAEEYDAAVALLASFSAERREGILGRLDAD